MKCDRCDNTATVHLIEIKGGKKIEKHLCEEHAVEEGVAVPANKLPIDELLEKFVAKHGGESPEGSPTEMRCHECGMTYGEFRKTGLLGCAGCYVAFEVPLKPLLERAHEGSTRHIGKIPRHAGADEARQHKLAQLRRQLDEAVASEQYERAARLRDEVRTLEADKA